MTYKLVLKVKKFQLSGAKSFGRVGETSRGWIPSPIPFRVCQPSILFTFVVLRKGEALALVGRVLINVQLKNAY